MVSTAGPYQTDVSTLLTPSSLTCGATPARYVSAARAFVGVSASAARTSTTVPPLRVALAAHVSAASPSIEPSSGTRTLSTCIASLLGPNRRVVDPVLAQH